jgi:hypothetical protein
MSLRKAILVASAPTSRNAYQISPGAKGRGRGKEGNELPQRGASAAWPASRIRALEKIHGKDEGQKKFILDF